MERFFMLESSFHVICCALHRHYCPHDTIRKTSCQSFALYKACFCAFSQYEKAVCDIKKWDRAAYDAQQTLAQTLVLSHRDLDPKNVMWNGAEPLVIDWEAAGYINPYQEFLEVLNYWADDGDGGLVRSYFDALAKAYGKHMSLAEVPWDAVFAGSYSGMIGWLDYNVKRALGMEASDEAEIRLGEEQVVGTIGALYDYCDKVKQMQEWLGIKNDR